MLVDWMELFRGESIELVYTFALRLHKEGRELGFTIACLGYDNACKLLSLARLKAAAIAVARAAELPRPVF